MESGEGWHQIAMAADLAAQKMRAGVPFLETGEVTPEQAAEAMRIAFDCVEGIAKRAWRLAFETAIEGEQFEPTQEVSD